MNNSHTGRIIFITAVLAAAALACRAVVPAVAPTPTLEVIATAVSTEAVWEPGSAHPDYPHVIASDTEGQWQPEAGYVWASEDPADLSVIWQAGEPSPTHPNVVSAEEEGQWAPAPGYEWANPDDSSNWDVIIVQDKIEILDVEQNVDQDGKAGMRIHMSFNVEGRKNSICALNVFFFLADGRPLNAMPNDSAHTSTNGQLVVFEDFTPTEDSYRYDDYNLFVPYDSFNVDLSSSVDLKLQARVYDRNLKSDVVQSDMYDFTIAP